jgi:hypothetical protein
MSNSTANLIDALFKEKNSETLTNQAAWKIQEFETKIESLEYSIKKLIKDNKCNKCN